MSAKSAVTVREKSFMAISGPADDEILYLQLPSAGPASLLLSPSPLADTGPGA